MAFVIRYFANELMDMWEQRDSRLDHLPMTSALSLAVVVGIYAFSVGKLGPSVMKERQPFALNKAIAVYNLFQIAVNIWFIIYSVYNLYWYKPEFNFACQPSVFGTTNMELQEIRGGYYFYLLKMVDFLDTIFFTLKKKFSHVTFLHVYHHVAVLICSYLVMKWNPAGHFIIVGVINCFVHAIMYSYYLLSICKPELKENVEIKKMVTKVQLVQFGIIIFFFGRPLLMGNCSIPTFFLLLPVIQNVVLIFLFSDFYCRNYYKKND